ncbi:hypothetical protein ASE39_16780 [Acidovorax sp. Root267]|nr:hypothetical protein ASE39_16780 [Acidovorax sp. Root267]
MPDTAFDPFASAAVITMARQGRTPRPLDLPAALRPRDATEAYAVQDIVVRERGEIAGWKVGAASPQAQPTRAALTRDSVFVAQTVQAVHLSAAGFAVMGVEAELVYELGADLPARSTPYSAVEVLAAVTSVRAAIEVCDTRFAAWGLQGEWSRLADQACHGALIVGAGVADVAAVKPLAQAVSLSVNGMVAVQHATWGNAAGDPLGLLVWLANEGARSLGGLRWWRRVRWWWLSFQASDAPRFIWCDRRGALGSPSAISCDAGCRAGCRGDWIRRRHRGRGRCGWQRHHRPGPSHRVAFPSGLHAPPTGAGGTGGHGVLAPSGPGPSGGGCHAIPNALLPTPVRAVGVARLHAVGVGGRESPGSSAWIGIHVLADPIE